MPTKEPAHEVIVCVYGMTDVGSVRKTNEDTFLVAEMTSGHSGLSPEVLVHNVGDRGTLLLVSDGMGGAEAGEVASRMVAQHVSLELAAMPADMPARDAIREAVERANEAVWS